MNDPTVSTLCRRTQHILDKAYTSLEQTITLARTIGLAPFHVASIQAAIDDNKHAWTELNLVARALELSGTDHKL